MIRKPEQRLKAIELRKTGKSVKDIGKLLGVSSSTVSLWVRHIPLSQSQKDLLTQKVFTALQRGRIKAELVQRELREKRNTLLTKEAVKKLGKFTKRDLFVAGIALYWAEGFKKDNRLGFANSDPQMVKLFLKWLEALGVPKSSLRLRVGVNISHSHRLEEIQSYWSKQTGVPLTQFQKPFFQKFKWKKEYPDPSTYFGVLRIRANEQGPLFFKIKNWISILQATTTCRA